MGVNNHQVEFFKAKQFAVVGASTDRAKYGNKVFRWYLSQGLSVIPINPTQPEVEDHKAVPSLSALLDPSAVSVSVITPPKVTRGIIEEAAKLGIKNIWLQPGAESAEAIQLATDHKMNIIAGGPCVLVSGEEAKRAAAAPKM
ncbi:hypothetical protein HDU85_000465 [Gaertneriomyces sp. JEL0708]|nr:hypothetical protein HDU85_000465 [Gaertneriomyces sp. JEL0708]